MLTVGSLFSGIGGLELGLERAGMKCLWQVEIDTYCQKVLRKHWPEADLHSDIRECGAANLVPVDLICGGFPCQPHSLAGKRKASEDERDLWGEFARIVRELRPRWVLAENVPGLLSSESGRFFGRVLRDLAALGYCVEWESIPAAAVGAPHRRDRVFIVADAIRPECESRAGRRGVWEGDSQQREMANAEGTGQSLCFMGSREVKLGRSSGGNESWWAVEPDVGRVAHGVPSRVDRLRCLGNAVVPQVAEWIGRKIIDFDRA